jgi:HSP20 family protein
VAWHLRYFIRTIWPRRISAKEEGERVMSTSLMKNTDYPELGWVRRELDRLTGALRPFELFKEGDALAAWSPAVDISEDESAISIKADLPEVDRKDIEVSVENGMLTIRGERKREKEDKKKNYHRIERSFGSYVRSFSLPESVDKDKIAAECKNGVLTVTLPKRPEAKTKAAKIEVK